jgi:precorrin-3B C17-methyltransferase
MLTIAAEHAIKNADVIIGNDFYITQIAHLCTHQEIITSHMGREVDRAKTAISRAQDKKVVMVSGGDPGVYGMAPLILEIRCTDGARPPHRDHPWHHRSKCRSCPLGAPLSNDFAVISLSDFLTPVRSS